MRGDVLNSPARYTQVGPPVKERTFQTFSSRYEEASRFQRFQLMLWMILSLLGGVAFAIGHHVFYTNYHNERVDDVELSQDWIVRIGTGLAFLSLTLMSFTASTAFTQHQWLAIRSKPFKIRQLDIISSILHNVLAFFTSRVWLRFPILTILAATAWLLPIAAVFTPATITVTLFQDISNRSSTVPQLFFDPNQYGNLQITVRQDYIGPSSTTQRTAFGSAMTGQILPIPAANPNMSYTLQFIGPALRCDHAEPDVIEAVGEAYDSQLAVGIENEYHYIAWVPISSGRYNLTNSQSSSSSSAAPDSFLDLQSTDAAHLYIIPNTSVAGPVSVGGIPITDPPYGYEDTLDCKLYNASYEVLLNFTFPSQQLTVQSRELLNPVNVSVNIGDWYFGQNEPDPTGLVGTEAQRICYQSIMESLGRLLVGNEYWRDGFVIKSMTSWDMVSIDWTVRDAAIQGVEELFQNITLSMLSVSSLTMNETLAAQNPVPVSVLTTFNIYDYHTRDLWLAYGIAIGAALVCALLGAYAMLLNSAVYQNLFSTYLRTARDLGLQNLIDPRDSGAEPLPSDLAETSVRLATR